MVLPYINMHPPQLYTCSSSWNPLPPPSLYHPSGSSQCTSPKFPVSCIEPGLAIHILYDIAKSLQSCPTLCDPIDGSPPGSPSLGSSRQEHWSRLPFPSPMHESESEVAQLCLTLRDPMDCSPPGSSVHGILHVLMPFSQIIPPPSPTESKRLFYTSVSLLLSRI